MYFIVKTIFFKHLFCIRDDNPLFVKFLIIILYWLNALSTINNIFNNNKRRRLKQHLFYTKQLSQIWEFLKEQGVDVAAEVPESSSEVISCLAQAVKYVLQLPLTEKFTMKGWLLYFSADVGVRWKFPIFIL